MGVTVTARVSVGTARGVTPSLGEAAGGGPVRKPKRKRVEGSTSKGSTANTASTYRNIHQIKVDGVALDDGGKPTGASYEPPAPIATFAAAPFHSGLRAVLESMGFDAPTPIQAQSW